MGNLCVRSESHVTCATFPYINKKVWGRNQIKPRSQFDSKTAAVCSPQFFPICPTRIDVCEKDYPILDWETLTLVFQFHKRRPLLNCRVNPFSVFPFRITALLFHFLDPFVLIFLTVQLPGFSGAFERLLWRTSLWNSVTITTTLG